ncbi:MAG TPA: lysophospholipid acyltransferase family protein [Acidimicrobiia bacterium]
MEPLYGLAEFLLRRPMRHAFRWRIEGMEHIPPTGPALLASNHVSYLDPLFLCYVTDQVGRRVRFLAKAELFENRLAARALRSMGEIPVERGTADASGALEAASAALARGELVAVFPEGTISRDLDPMAGKTGAARLARASGVPVLPVGLWGGHRLITAGRRRSWRLGVAVTAVVGEPFVIGPDENPRLATDRIMEAICAQVARARAIYPQVPRPGRPDWWVRPPESARLRSCRGRVAQALLDDAAPVPGTPPILGSPPVQP